jgi:NAD(P)-dependent dehydrogenase (short-subunit alcohol dehydrogenase family)
MRVSGKVAMVTGGASGLGRAVADELAGAGGRVVIADLAGSHGEAVADGLGEQARFIATDVTSEGDVRAAIDLAVGGFGGLHVVVNCAGVGTAGRVFGKRGPLPLEEFSMPVSINLIGTFNVIRLAVPAMLDSEPVEGERGVIVNTASIAAFDGQIGQVAYAASKGGVVAMTLPLARDLADKLIRVMTIAPGTFDTPMLAALPEPARTALAAAIPHPRRLGRPAEFALLVHHIVENPMLNGEVIRLDGALRMAPM